jgi:CPA2 family monovalent cation:H+ antiporter-2
MLLPVPERFKSGLLVSAEAKKEEHKDHIVIIGFGLAGRTLAKMAQSTSLPYLVLEMNPDTVRKEQLKGEPIHFGDATHESILHHMHVHTAKTVAIMINDSQACKRVVQMVRRLNPEAYVIVRTRYMQEVPIMRELGADDVVSDELGSSLEMSYRVLKNNKIAEDKIEGILGTVRSENGGFKMQGRKQALPDSQKLNLAQTNNG